MLRLNRKGVHELKITPVILSGGGGTRLWPMSRPECPKQFLALMGDQTMFQMTLQRCRDESKFAPPLIVASAAHADIIDEQLEQITVSNAAILLEPCARNTAPAIALAALAASDPSTPLLVMPSDHVIEDILAFRNAIDAALPMVAQGWLATFGIKPTAPEAGYGYIQMGAAIASGVQKVSRFVEKPDALRASEMIAAGDHVWNGGIFLFQAGSFLNALAIHAPDMLTACRASMEKAAHRGNRIYPDKEEFAASPSISIDYAVMEKADQVCTAPVSMGWSDVGSWDALYELGKKSSPDNILEIDGHGNLICTDGIKIHTAGMTDMIVIAQGNDVMIVPRGHSQDVKKIVDALSAQ